MPLSLSLSLSLSSLTGGGGSLPRAPTGAATISTTEPSGERAFVSTTSVNGTPRYLYATRPTS